jgi:hypothetical protein
VDTCAIRSAAASTLSSTQCSSGWPFSCLPGTMERSSCLNTEWRRRSGKKRKNIQNASPPKPTQDWRVSPLEMDDINSPIIPIVPMTPKKYILNIEGAPHSSRLLKLDRATRCSQLTRAEGGYRPIVCGGRWLTGFRLERVVALVRG